MSGVERSRERIRATLERVIESLHVVMEENEELANMPGHEESARQRVTEAQAELARAKEELARLDRGERPIG